MSLISRDDHTGARLGFRRGPALPAALSPDALDRFYSHRRHSTRARPRSSLFKKLVDKLIGHGTEIGPSTPLSRPH